MQYDSYAEDARDKMFHISQMLGSAIWFSGLADEAATEDDGDLFYYFCSLLQILACSDDPGLHIFSYGSLRDAYSTYDESAAYFRGRGSREQNLDWVVESAARMVLFVDDSPRDERISIVHSLASEAGYAIPDAMEIVDKLMHELDAPFDSCEEDGKDMDRIVPGFFLFRSGRDHQSYRRWKFNHQFVRRLRGNLIERHSHVDRSELRNRFRRHYFS